MLREAGLDYEEVRRVLGKARRGFLMHDNEMVEMLATNFARSGCSGLMSLYIAGVREIHDLAVTMVRMKDLSAIRSTGKN